MAKYVYKNLKGVIINGIEPHGTKEFDNTVEGGAIQLVSVIDDVKIDEQVKNKKKVK